MKIRIAIHLVVAIALVLFASGCCTALLVNSASYTTRDTFSPSAVYQTTNRDSFALEGIRFNEGHGSPTNHVFVIMPKANLMPLGLRTNDSLSIDDIKTLQPPYTKGLKTKKQLPPEYEKIHSLRPNQASIVIREHHPKAGLYVFLPVTVAADIVTSPVQIAFFGFLWWSFKTHGMGC